jgi:tetratricopeptide (TPR) repeat protein
LTLGGLLFNRRYFAEAEQHFYRVFELQPGHPDIHNNLGVLLKAQKEFVKAELWFRKGLECKQDHILICNLGRLYVESCRWDEAESCFRQALALKPDFVGAFINLGVLFERRAQTNEAEFYFCKAIEQDTKCVDAYAGLGKICFDQKRYEEAETFYAKAITIKPDDAALHNNLGILYSQMRRYRDAEAAYRRMLEIDAEHVIGHLNFANMLADAERYDEAEKHFRIGIELQPSFADAYFGYGNLLKIRDRFSEALAAYRKALALTPESAAIYNGLGSLYYENGNFEEAELHFKKAVQIDPGFHEANSNLGVICKKNRHFSEAEDYYHKALLTDPDSPTVIFNLSLVALAQANFEDGWSLYEARFDARSKKPISVPPVLPYPRWQGEPLIGKSIVVWHEQGFGDVIQFSRYVAILKCQGAKHISVMCKHPLRSLLQTLDGVDRVISFADRENLGFCDYWTFPLSIPLYCQTRLDTIPTTIGYISAPSEYKQKWQHRFSMDRMTVGIVWKGAAAHTGDRERSLESLKQLRPLWDIPGITFVSLQKGQAEDEAAVPPFDQPLINLGAEVQDFADAAAIVDQLDLVICVDTAVAHLAGALGKPVWALIPYAADWRWMLDREDSPWYPTMRLFRQKKRGEWGEVINRIKGCLLEQAEQYWLKLFEKTPADACLSLNVGDFYLGLGRCSDAEIHYRNALKIKPDFLPAYSQLGSMFMNEHKFSKAEAVYRQVLLKYPTLAAGHFNLAQLLKETHRFEEAEKHYKSALSEDPCFFEAQFSLGILFQSLGRLHEAEIAYASTLSLRPNYAEAYVNLGNVFKDRQMLDEAEASYRKALSLKLDYVDAYDCLGNILNYQNRFDEAEAMYKQALAIQPDSLRIKYNLSFLFLAAGRFAEGWPLYETRYNPSLKSALNNVMPVVSFPQWQGENIIGKSLVVWWEQGFGDVIQFARYIPVLKQLGASRITFICKGPLKPLLESLNGIDLVLSFEEQQRLQPHDYWTFPLSIPLYSRYEGIPRDIPYLTVSTSTKDRWRKRIAVNSLKVGIVWKGSKEHMQDVTRSLASIEDLRPLWTVPDVVFISLQKGQCEDEAIFPPADQPLIHLGPDIHDFADTAAIIGGLDLVICVDTAVAHLTGALGKPVWVLLPFSADWRWMLNREDSPWYPTMRLFRQQQRGHWGGVVVRIREELDRFVKQKRNR